MRKRIIMSESDAQIIVALAENGMRPKATADALHYCPSSMYYRFQKIRERTGLNPRGFFDLMELLQIAKEVLGEEGGGL